MKYFLLASLIFVIGCSKKDDAPKHDYSCWTTFSGDYQYKVGTTPAATIFYQLQTKDTLRGVDTNAVTSFKQWKFLGDSVIAYNQDTTIHYSRSATCYRL